MNWLRSCATARNKETKISTIVPVVQQELPGYMVGTKQPHLTHMR